MYKKLVCLNKSCPDNQKANGGAIIRKGSYKRNGVKTQRFQCKTCKQTFSTHTDNPQNKLHNHEILKDIFERYTNGYSVSNLSQDLKLDKKTILKCIKFIGTQCRLYHYELLNTGFLSTDKIFFDEMESYIHSKVYPVSIGLAVDVQYSKIIDIATAEIKLKGALKKKVKKDLNGNLPDKILLRPNNSPMMLDGLMKNIKKAIRPNGFIYSDKKKTYKFLVNKYLDKSITYQPEKSRTSITDSSIPLELGRFSSVCNHIRNHTSRMGRRSFITSKKKIMLDQHLFMVIARYNEYDFKTLINFKENNPHFFDNHWQTLKRKKVIRLAHQKAKLEKQQAREQKAIAFLAMVLFYQKPQLLAEAS